MPAPLATPTVARLLAEQGHPEKALAVADDVLRRNPGDARALAVRASLEQAAAGARGRDRVRTHAWSPSWNAGSANLARRKHGGARA